jgi:Calx-beta domain
MPTYRFPRAARRLATFAAALFVFCATAATFLYVRSRAATAVPMSTTVVYVETFADMANWTNNFAAGIGANRYSAVTAGAFPNPTQTTVFTTSTTGGVQKGTGNIILLATGATDNTSAAAFDLLLNFNGVNAGAVSLDWAEVNNSTGDRAATFKLQTNTGAGGAFVDLPGASVSVTNNVASSGSLTNVSLPSGFNGNAGAVLRFYVVNGTGGTTGSRPKISIDNVRVTVGAPNIKFRSAASGNWNANATWEMSTDGTNWVAAVTTPTSSNDTITIRNGHIVTVSAAVSADQVTVNSGGILSVAGGVALTLDDGSGNDITVDAGGIFAAAGSVTNNGQAQISGTLRIDEGGFPGNGTGTYAYGQITGALFFNNTSGPYGVNNVNFWPTTNGPQNVSVGTGGMQLNVARAVGLSFDTSSGLFNAGNLSVGANGTFTLFTGGFVSGSPTYASGSILKYATGGTYGRASEWLPGATSGAGYPGAVQVTANTTLDLPNSSTTQPFQTANSLTVASGSALTMAGATPTTAALTVLGDVVNQGTLTLSTASGGDIHVHGSWSDSGTFTPNGRAVFFDGVTTQVISRPVGETFDYLVINKSAGNGVNLLNDVTVNATSGNALQLLGGTLNLMGSTLRMNGGGGNLLVSGGTRNVTSSSGAGTFEFNGAKTVTSASSGALDFASAVTVNLSSAVNFGGVSTVNGTLSIKSGGSVNTNPPTYAAGSTLEYDNGTSYNASAEFPATGVQNVSLASTTQLNLNGDKTVAGAFNAGSRTIGSTAATPFSLTAATINLSTGTLDLNNVTTTSAFNATGAASVNVAGDWNVAGFGAGASTVNFDGAGAQTVQTASAFNNLTASNDLTLGASPTIGGTLALGSKKITTGANTLSLGNSAVVTRASGYVLGAMQKSFSAPASFTFHVGTANGYTPVDAGSTTGAGTLSVRPAQTKQPNVSGANALSRYWTLSGTGLTTNLTFHYLDGDIVGDENGYEVVKYDGSFSIPSGQSVNAAANTATVNGVSSFSDWTLAEAPSVFGALQFGAANYDDAETNSGTHNVNVTVQRAGGSSAAVSVHYATSDGTASDGSDYSATSGDLNWADGDATDKTFTVTVNGDASVEPDETINLTLSSPTGGATLGSPSAATVTIQNDDASPDYTVTTGATITVTDVSGNGDTLFVTEPAPGQIKFAAAGRTFLVNGSTLVSGDSGNLSLSNVSLVTINQGGGGDTLTFSAFTSNMPSLTVNGDAGDDAVNFNGSITFAPGASLDADLQDDSATPGTDTVTVAAQLTASGAGSIDVRASKNVTVGSGGRLQTQNGGLTVEANRQATPTSGDFDGVDITGGTVQTTGSGSVSVKGTGGEGDFTDNNGVFISAGGQVLATGGGTIDVEGAGGAGAGGASAGNSNLGVYVTGANSLVNSSSGAIDVSGTGGATNDTGSYGVVVENLGEIRTSGAGTLNITGQGGAVTGGSPTFVNSAGVFVIPDENGDNGGVVSSNGTGANAGDIVINGTSGPAGAGAGQGIRVDGPGTVTTVDGSVTFNGTGAACGNACLGTSIRGNVEATGAGSINITGTGAASTGAFPTHGVNVRDGGLVQTKDGDITITGTGGNGGNNAGFNLAPNNAGTLRTTGLGNVTVNADRIVIRPTGAFATIDAGAHAVTLRQKTNGAAINLGSPSDATANTVELSDAELDRITAAGLIDVGDSNSGAVTVGANITRASATNFNLTSGANIDIAGGSLGSAGGNVALNPGTNTFPSNSGVDVNAAAGTLTLASAKDLKIVVNSATADTGYTQLNVAGLVNLNGAGLALGGSHVPAAGQSFVVVNNDGADAIVGTFNGLPEGATITNFLGSGRDAVITYAGGDGNDAVLTVVTPSFSVDDVTQAEGNSGASDFTFTVTKTGAGAASVDFATQDGTATAGSDYTSGSGTLNFGAAETTKQVLVSVSGDTTPEANETFTVHLSNASGAGVADADGTGTITNDDARPAPATVYVDDDWTGTTAGADPDGAGPATEFGYDAFATIQTGVDAVATGGTVNVYAGTYDEDVNVNKAGLSLLGFDAGVKTVRGAIGGDAATFHVNASNVTIAGFTITRLGNNPAQWNDPGLNNAGVAIQGLSITNALIRDNVITGNRTGIDINNSGGHTVRNNSLTDNRTGLIFRNQTDQLTVVENFVTGNWTVGILFLDASGGTNSPAQTAAHSTFGNNDLSGNWYGQVVDRQSGGSLPAPNTTNLKNFRGNWWGTVSPVVTTANSAEPGYAAQIPVEFGGSATPPGGQPDIAGPASANVKYLPLLTSGTDTNVETTPGRGTDGFQGAHAPVLVWPPDQQGWVIQTSSTATAGFVEGPATPPLGAGSGQLSVGADGDAAAQFRQALFNGTPLSDLTALGYSTYTSIDGTAPAVGDQTAYVILNVDLDGDGTNDTLLFFEPEYQHGYTSAVPDQGDNVLNTWQTWDALHGGWWSTTGAAGANPGSDVKPLSDIIAAFPNARIHNSSTSGSLRLVAGFGAGSWDNFAGNVDNVTVGVGAASSTYDFEPLPSLSVGDVSMDEGDSGTTDFDFKVTLSHAVATTVTVDYSTADSTAAAGDDYAGVTTTQLTFNPGETSKQVTVQVNGDTTFEPDETFFVNLSNPSNATLLDAQGTGTIRNDDAQASFSVGDVSHAEGNSGTTLYTFTVTKTGSAAGASSVNFTTVDATATAADNDYQPNSGTLSFAAEETTKQFTVLVNGDTTPETDEAFSVLLSNASNAVIGDDTGAGAITNDDESVAAGQLVISEFRLRGPGNGGGSTRPARGPARNAGGNPDTASGSSGDTTSSSGGDDAPSAPAPALNTGRPSPNAFDTSPEANDEFVELYNSTAQDLLVTTTDGSRGWSVVASGGVELFFVPNGTVIPAHGHYLGTNAVGYSLGAYAAGDTAWAGVEVPDNAGLALFRTGEPTSYNMTTRLDAVGSTAEPDALYREGAGYPALSPSDIALNLEHSFYRSTCSFVNGVGCTTPGLPKDSDDNAADFLFVDTSGTQTAAGKRLGTPGPEGLPSPVQRNADFGFAPLDRSKATSSAPNRSRDFTPDLANNSPQGTLAIRRRVTNSTGTPVAALRFRIIELTTYPNPPGTADLRAITSANVTVSNVADPDTCGASPVPCDVTVQGTTLETPPAQAQGGGYNSSLAAGTINLGAPLAAGQSVNLQFVLGVVQSGTFRFYINIEALNSPPAPDRPQPGPGRR